MRRRGTPASNPRIAASTPPGGNMSTSYRPVLAPLGAAARATTLSTTTSTSTVGFPRESRIFRMRTRSMDGIGRPRHRDRQPAALEFPDRDFHRVDAPRGLGQEGWGPHGELERSGADDASSFKT